MKPLLLLFLLTPLLFLNEATAQNASGGVRTFKDILKDVPAKEILKLWGPKRVETAMAISLQINAREVGKVGTYRGKVSKIDPYSYPNENLIGWRLAVVDDFKRGGDTLAVFSWVMVHTDPHGMIPKIRVGDEVTVTGKVNRAELTATDVPRLNVDLIVPEMNDGKGIVAKSIVEKPIARSGVPVPASLPAVPGTAPKPMAEPVKDYALDRIMDALPEETRAKLTTVPLSADSIPAINSTLAALAVKKPFKLTFVVDSAGVVPGQPQNYRLRAANGLLSGKYAAIPQQWVHLYLPSEKATEVAKVSIGDTLTMTGTISRCDIITNGKGYQFQLNMNDAQITSK
jgi:hypothetical protein